MDPLVTAVFALTYAGMMLGGWPGLALDRSGIALLGAIVLLATGRITMDGAVEAIDAPTLALLFGLMVVSAQFRLSGFYGAIVDRLARRRPSPAYLLALVIGAAGLLSAILVNDIVCLAMTPAVITLCRQQQLDARPFLLALACASNAGSAATLIGNPQNMLVGEVLGLPFTGYLWTTGVPALAGLGAVWAIVHQHWRTRYPCITAGDDPEVPVCRRGPTIKGLVVVALVMAAFLLTDWPRALVALAAAGVLLVSRDLASREMVALVDWHLLVLFSGLFIVNHAMQQTGAPAALLASARQLGLDLAQPVPLFATTVLLSNLVSNVPAVMLLLPAATHVPAGPILALASTLAGNLLLVGSIANLIVVEEARRADVRNDWRMHLRIGAPVTLATLVLSGGWLWMVG
ncbi:MAG: anion transporter [Acidobacteria bacterium]|nr:anion transporter [Acidobacteriota bacterium]